MLKGTEPLKIEEIGNTYVGPEDRFVVSLVVGYNQEDSGVRTAKQAARAALQLTLDEGSNDTHWYVFDRKTGVLSLFEQKEIE